MAIAPEANIALHEHDNMPIAVVGMGFRGPGEATNVEKFWNMVLQAREAWSPVPKEKWNNDAFYHPDASRNGTSNVLAGHYFTEDLSRFDAPFFNMTSAEAEALDPQQRLLLECCYEALENAGTPLDQAMGSNTSVFVGSFCGDYTDVLLRDTEAVPLYQATSSGHSRAIIANRLSYFFDFKGPSVTIDTACSSSLVALHLACQSLRTGEARQAIVAGANVILSHEITISMSMMRFLSPDGRCYTFDDRANGYARGEGVGCVFLKTLDQALKDGDTIRGIIRNTGVNQDGRTPGITLPSQQAQEILIESVYRKVGIDPLETAYVECHGTGTPAGDPLETAAISNVLGKDRSYSKPLRIGSVKTNVGHLEGASGVAGVIKSVLMLENEMILPNRNFENGNKKIPFYDWKLTVPTVPMPWDTAGPRRISINSFGYGGTNAHAILEDARGYLRSHGVLGNTMATFSNTAEAESIYRHGSVNGYPNGYTNGYAEHSTQDVSNGHANNLSLNSAANTPRAQVFLLSAFEESTGKQQTTSLLQYLRKRLDRADQQFLADLAFTLGERRSRLPWKSAVTASTIEQLIDELENPALKFSRSSIEPALAYVFTGQGAQWHAMGRELIQVYPVFANSLRKIGCYLKLIGSSWDLIDELRRDSSKSHVEYLSQPLCTAIQIALVDLLASWNIKPLAVTGHSSGEIAAAYAVGALSLEDAMTVAYYRGVFSNDLKDSGLADGAMIAVGMSKQAAMPLLSTLKQGQATIACENSPSSITVSGDALAVAEFEIIMKQKGIFARLLPVRVAYHSAHMKIIADRYLAAISHIKARATDSGIQFFSSVTGHHVVHSELGAPYWIANLLGEVRFAESLLRLCLETTTVKKARKRKVSSAVHTIIELGPHSALAGPIKQILQSDQRLVDNPINYLTALVRNSNAVYTTLSLVSKLLMAGYPVSLAKCNRTDGEVSGKVLVDLPSYTWNHSLSYWAESRSSKTYRHRAYPRSDILGVLDRGTNPLEPTWRNFVRASEIPWIKDHKVQTSVVYPAAGYLVMAIEAAHQRAMARGTGISGYVLREVSIGQALVVSEKSRDIETVVSLRPYSENTRSASDLWDEFYVYSVTEDERWTEHCHGLVSVQKRVGLNEVSGTSQSQTEAAKMLHDVSQIKSRCKSELDTKAFYEQMSLLGLDYGPTFANMRRARVGPNVCVGVVSIPDTAATMPMGFQYPTVIHPATLDSLFHGLFAALAADTGPLNDPMVPIFLEELFVASSVSSDPDHNIIVYTSTESKKASRQINASMTAFGEDSEDGSPWVTIKGLACTTIASDAPEQIVAKPKPVAYNLTWEVDVDLLSEDGVADLCAHTQLAASEKDTIQDLEQAGYYHMVRALQIVPSEKVENMLHYHKRLWACMKAYVAAVEQERLSMPTASWKATTATERAAHIKKVTASGPEGNLLCHIGTNLPLILGSKADALQLMVEEGRLDAYYKENARFNCNYQAAARYFDLLGHKNPHLRILEIGAGTGGATLPILQSLNGPNQDLPRFALYDFTDISSGFFDTAKEKLEAWSDLITYRKLDIEKDPESQGYKKGSYDIVVAANVLHATKSMQDTMTNVRKLLKLGGKLVLIELTRERLTTSTIFGTLPGWWAGEESHRRKGPTLTEQEWIPLLRNTGFSGLDASVWDSALEATHQGSMMVATAVGDHKQRASLDVLLICDETTPALLVDRLTAGFDQCHADTTVATLSEANPSGKLCVVMSEITNPFLSDPTSEQFDVMKKIFTTAKGILWVTRGAQISSSMPASNLVFGFARTVRSEYGGTKIVVMDLDAQEILGILTADLIFNLFLCHFGQTTHTIENLDVEYSQKKGKLMIPRLIENRGINKIVHSTTSDRVPELQLFHQDNCPLVLEIGTPGLLDTLHFVHDRRVMEPLPDDNVEIQVVATGFNFKDVMMAMGQIEVEALGLECSGIVKKVGKSVRSVALGDRVSCFAFGAFSNFIRVNDVAVQILPADMSWEMAACLPVVYCTAYYSVFHVARVVKGERVLIHAASGGLGQATIELCQMIGAEIFTTVGTIPKKNFLMSRYGIPEDHIFSSRDSGFAKGIMNITNKRGVDVIMNSVAGEMLRITWECIAPFGRFVELGARDYTINTRLEMHKFAQNVTFVVVNLVSLVRERPEMAAQVWSDVMNLFRSKNLNGPSPITVFGMSEIEKALRTMQSGKHMGKLVAIAQPGEMVKAIPRDLDTSILRDDVSYLLVGGLGGIGRAMALWMVDHGAKNLIFASRSGLAKEEARVLVGILRERGASVAVYNCDISNAAQLASLLDATSKMPPIHGVIQGAMVLQDSLVETMSLTDYNAAIRPKVQGTWNLHNQLPKDLDFFLMLSSTSGIIGNASQAAYAASSTFLDAFANYRNSLGLPAVTIDLGVILGVGYVAENSDLAKNLERQGFEGTTEKELMTLIQTAITSLQRPGTLGQVVTGLGTWSEASGAAYEYPMFSHFRRMALKSKDSKSSDSEGKVQIREELRNAKTLDAAASKIYEAVILKISSLSMISVDDISESRPMSEYGMDSLVAVEMRNWLFREMDATVPILELLANQSLARLAEKIARRSKLVDAAVVAKTAEE